MNLNKKFREIGVITDMKLYREQRDILYDKIVRHQKNKCGVY